MASIIKASINLDMIDKSKIYVGKKGKYLPITITINDEVDNYGNQGPVVIEQTKEEREAKAAKIYLGNVKLYGQTETTLLQRLELINLSKQQLQLDHQMIYLFNGSMRNVR